jgi:hypothetical protein
MVYELFMPYEETTENHNKIQLTAKRKNSTLRKLTSFHLLKFQESNNPNITHTTEMNNNKGLQMGKLLQIARLQDQIFFLFI